jgi:hypothetical protein
VAEKEGDKPDAIAICKTKWDGDLHNYTYDPSSYEEQNRDRIVIATSSLARESAEETVLVFLLHHLTFDNSKVFKLTRRDTSSVQHLNLSVGSVLCLGLEEPESSDDEQLGTNEQEHNSAAPIELIEVDEVREDRRQHECSELLTDQGERDGLWSSCLRSSLLSNSPAVATNSSSLQHRPGDHEDQESSVGCNIVGACY